MRLALAPLNPTIGDLDANAALAREAISAARERGADLVVLPELVISGYPPKDLLMQQGFVDACTRVAHAVGAASTTGITAVFGVPLRASGASHAITNSLLAFRDGVLTLRYDKQLLPTYDVFDEDRYFTPGREPAIVTVPGASPTRVGLSVCEDLWKGEDAGFASRYHDCPDPVASVVNAGAQFLVSPSASPFVVGKGVRHRDILQGHAKRHAVGVASVNQLGGNDELVFDGHALVYSPAGALTHASRLFSGDLLIADIAAHGAAAASFSTDDDHELFDALVLGVRDYLRKTGHSRALIGLSGGIDSALTAVIAAAAIGPGNVLGVAMPGPYSSDHSIADAQDLARRLGTECMLLPIGAPMDGFRSALDPVMRSHGLSTLGERLPDLTEENLQSRIRGTTLMALSNRTGALVLTTGNKSELSVGYCTLYGDMNGGLAVLSDLSKQWVYRLSRWINTHHARIGFTAPPIPDRTITKAPSAELRPDQTDQDSLPPYDVLDEILARYVEGRQPAGVIARETGFDTSLVARIVRLVDVSEFKRNQMAVGLKVTRVAFGSGRRFPIAQRYRSPV